MQMLKTDLPNVLIKVWLSRFFYDVNLFILMHPGVQNTGWSRKGPEDLIYINTKG